MSLCGNGAVIVVNKMNRDMVGPEAIDLLHFIVVLVDEGFALFGLSITQLRIFVALANCSRLQLLLSKLLVLSKNTIVKIKLGSLNHIRYF